jgi:hypothetical protein
MSLTIDDYQVQFMEIQGLQVLTNLVSSEESKIKNAACLALSKAVKSIEAQMIVRDLGLLPVLSSNLVSNDIYISSSAATVIAAISRNGDLYILP